MFIGNCVRVLKMKYLYSFVYNKQTKQKEEEEEEQQHKQNNKKQHKYVY